MKLRLGADTRGRKREPVTAPQSFVDTLGVSHEYKPDKQGCLDIPEEFQEVIARALEAGFVPVATEPEED